jgi:hypothetical protein
MVNPITKGSFPLTKMGLLQLSPPITRTILYSFSFSLVSFILVKKILQAIPDKHFNYIKTFFNTHSRKIFLCKRGGLSSSYSLE